MTRVKRRKLAAAATIAVAALGGVAVGTLPAQDASVVTTASAIDPAGLYNDAQSKFAGGDVTGGLELLQQVLAVAPADSDALALQAVWADQVEDVVAGRSAPGAQRAGQVQSALNRLSMMNPALATTARNIISGVATAAQIVPSTTPRPVSGRVAIVVLGYGLNANGKMAPELVNRVSAAKAQSELTTGAPVVVTGGVPKKGVTEAAAMRTWLVDNGVSASRILTEDKSGSTVANAQNTAEILRAQGIRDIVLITSPNHIRRGAADFGAMGLRVVGSLTTATELEKYQTPLAKAQQTGIRLEATRTARIPATHEPGLLPQNLPETGPGLIPEIGGKILQELLKAGSSA
ncbi:YdcF family protein [Gordonia McavH-238-E]|uniref:YdcF family protein n=1 Tax=Gordonia sp. McavH-238-E TaxID=2917736 RepID=UPI001EF57E90|nr:YdcF family protein [Gordonia sp. McavH-238-E]MCG7633449.1 YdcF family protein [Gordonia sp. McavH-238-E]